MYCFIAYLIIFFLCSSMIDKHAFNRLFFNTLFKYTDTQRVLNEEFERVTTVLKTEKGNKNGINDDYDCRPEVDLSALASWGLLVWHDKDEHEEGEGK